MNYLIVAFVFWNIITFIFMGIDKYKAIKKKWRVPESTLITLAFLLGGCGIACGMLVFRHKIRHLKFKILVPLAIALNVCIIVWIIRIV